MIIERHEESESGAGVLKILIDSRSHAALIEAALSPSCNSSLAPLRIVVALEGYRDRWLLPGDFLQAVLRNDLKAAIALADDSNVLLLRHIVAWCYTNLPSAAWGSREKIAEWLLGKQQSER